MLTHRILAYLIGLALGYWVLTLAEKEKNHTKTIGRAIGWIIIVVSFIGPLCLAGSALFCRSYGDHCSYSAQCPWSGGGWENHKMGGQCPMGMMENKPTPEAKENSK